MPISNKPRNSFSAEDFPEEAARRALIRIVAQVFWVFGVDPNSILVTKIRRALDLPGEQSSELTPTPPPGDEPAPSVARDMPESFFCVDCEVLDIRWSHSQKYCRQCKEARRIAHESKYKRKTPVTKPCERCGEEQHNWGSIVPRFCPACRSARQRERVEAQIRARAAALAAEMAAGSDRSGNFSDPAS